MTRKPKAAPVTDAERLAAVRAFYADIGRELTELVVDRVRSSSAEWRPADLLKLAELGRDLEFTAAAGDLPGAAAAGRSAARAVGAADEWDRLAVDLAKTLPPK